MVEGDNPDFAGETSKKKAPLWVWAVIAAIFSGGLMSLCCPPAGWHFVAWFALVPWLVALKSISPRQALGIGAILALVFYRINLGWLFELSGPHAAGVLSIFALLMGLGFYVVRILMERLGTGAILWSAPLLFAGHEIIRSESLERLRFAYGCWGYSQANNLWIAQIASLGGVYFLSFLIMAVNAAIAYAIIKRTKISLLPIGLIAVAVILLGWIAQPTDYSSLPQVPVACVQIESNYHRLHSDLTKEALKHPMAPKIIVLPEHSITDYTDEKIPLIKRLSKLALDHDAYICIGVHVRAGKGFVCDYDNVAMLIGPDGKILGTQLKAVPIPFFMDGNPAIQQQTFLTRFGSVGSYVCYDNSFTDVPRGLVDEGAELLLGPVMNPENWPPQQRNQQADMAIFRSIELRRCAVRAASSGITQIIDAAGKVQGLRTQEQDQGVLCGKVYFLRNKTFFARYGYWFNHIAGGAYLTLSATVLLVGILCCFAKRIKKIPSGIPKKS